MSFKYVFGNFLTKYIRRLYIRKDIEFGKMMEKTEYRRMTNDEFASLVKLHDTLFDDRFLRYTPYKSLDELKVLLPCGSIAQVDWIITDTWYVLLIRHFDCLEIYEMAGKNIGFSLMKVYRYIKSNYGNLNICATIRESTAYPILIACSKRGIIEVVSDKSRRSHGDIFHKVCFRLIDEVPRKMTSHNNE